MADTPRIYVACLASYNAGELHGEWIDANQSAEELREAIGAMLAKSPQADAEEYAIHDQDFFGGVEIAEYESLETVAAIASLIVEHDDLGAALYEYLGDVDKARLFLSEYYAGDFAGLGDWAESYLDEAGLLAGVPKDLRGYIDFVSYGEDQETNGVVFSLNVEQRVHVFWNR